MGITCFCFAGADYPGQGGFMSYKCYCGYECCQTGSLCDNCGVIITHTMKRYAKCKKCVKCSPGYFVKGVRVGAARVLYSGKIVRQIVNGVIWDEGYVGNTRVDGMPWNDGFVEESRFVSLYDLGIDAEIVSLYESLNYPFKDYGDESWRMVVRMNVLRQKKYSQVAVNRAAGRRRMSDVAELMRPVGHTFSGFDVWSVRSKSEWF